MTNQKHDDINAYLRRSLTDRVTVTTNARTGQTTDQDGTAYTDANDLLFRIADRTYRRNSTKSVQFGDVDQDSDDQGAA